MDDSGCALACPMDAMSDFPDTAAFLTYKPYGRVVIMSPNVAELFKQASALSDKDRAELIALLLESLEGEPDEGVEAAWAAEIERRIEEVDSGTIKTVPWEEVKAKLVRRLSES